MPLEAIPQELRAYPNWIVWKRENDSKVPYSPVTGRRADTTNAQEWASFEQACRFGQLNGFDGLGFCFSESPFAGVDLDPTDDPATLQWHGQVEGWLDSYTEISPSGRGKHVIVTGAVPQGLKRTDKAIEIYSDARYFTMTGLVSHPAPVRSVDLRPLWEYLAQPRAASTAVVSGTALVPDEQILSQAWHAANGAKFQALWRGDMTAYGNDHSAADQALINMLAYYTRDWDQIKRIFHACALGQRQKAYRPDYLDRTIRRAMDQQIPTVDFSGLKLVNGNGAHPKPVAPPPPVEWEKPPGLFGDIAEWIYQQAPYPVQEIALAGAMGMLAGICGRAYSVSNKGLNQYIVIVAETGRGKEAPASGITRLMSAVAQQEPAAQVFIGPGRFASGQGLLRRLSSPIPSFVSILGEVGHWLKEITGWRASAHDTKSLEVILDCWSKSGPSDVMHPTAYSDKMKDTAAVRAPAFSLLGESSPSIFYEAMGEASIRSGLLPRLLVIEYNGCRTEYNEAHETVQPSPQLVASVAQLCQIALKINSRNECQPVKLSVEAKKKNKQWQRECDTKINSETELLVELWNRAHLKTLKLAALLTAGINPVEPVIQVAEYELAMRFVREGIEAVQKRFESGEVGSPVNATRQDSDAKSVIDEYLSPAFDCKLAHYRLNPELRAARLIPSLYLRQRLRRVTSFREAPDTNRAIETQIRAWIDDGYLRKTAVKGASEISSIYFQINC